MCSRILLYALYALSFTYAIRSIRFRFCLYYFLCCVFAVFFSLLPYNVGRSGVGWFTSITHIQAGIRIHSSECVRMWNTCTSARRTSFEIQNAYKSRFAVRPMIVWVSERLCVSECVRVCIWYEWESLWIRIYTTHTSTTTIPTDFYCHWVIPQFHLCCIQINVVA